MDAGAPVHNRVPRAHESVHQRLPVGTADDAEPHKLLAVEGFAHRILTFTYIQ